MVTRLQRVIRPETIDPTDRVRGRQSAARAQSRKLLDRGNYTDTGRTCVGRKRPNEKCLCLCLCSLDIILAIDRTATSSACVRMSSIHCTATQSTSQLADNHIISKTIYAIYGPICFALLTTVGQGQLSFICPSTVGRST